MRTSPDRPVRDKTGLAGYVRYGPPIGSLLVAVFLLPFWLSSEITQASWPEWRKVLAVAALWAVVLASVGLAANLLAPEARVAAIPSVTPAATPLRTDPVTSPALPTPAATVTTPTPEPTPPPPTASRGLLPAPTFKGLVVVDEPFRHGYDRDLFNHWIDADDDGCDARDEVLIAESLDPVTVGPSCEFSGGRWYSAYDGMTLTETSRIHIDHVVALAEAWDSGASTWSADRRERFANDLGYGGSLIAVSASSNLSKSDDDPAHWQPRVESYACKYAQTWVKVKRRWGLTADRAEVAALRTMLDSCS